MRASDPQWVQINLLNQSPLFGLALPGGAAPCLAFRRAWRPAALAWCHLVRSARRRARVVFPSWCCACRGALRPAWELPAGCVGQGAAVAVLVLALFGPAAVPPFLWGGGRRARALARQKVYSQPTA